MYRFLLISMILLLFHSKTHAAGVLKTLVQDKRLLWPDSLGIGSDGYLYFTAAQINMEAAWHNGENKVEYPYQVYRVKLPE